MDPRRGSKSGFGATVKRNASILKFGGKKSDKKRSDKTKSAYDAVAVGNGDLQRQIDSWSDKEVEEKFDEMLIDMNLTSEDKKAPLRNKPIQEKRKMLVMQYRGTVIQKSSTNIESPASFVQELNHRELPSKQRFELLKQLRVSLTSNTVSWVMEFGPPGLEAILDNLNTCLQSTLERKSATECVRCLKAFVNSKFGLKQLLHHETALTNLAKAIDIRDPVTMLETVRLMAGVCLVPPDGHRKVLEGITDFNDLRQSEDRFSAIVKGMNSDSNVNLRVACLQLANAIISTPDELDFRLHLRNEFWRAGLIDLVEILDRDETEAVKLQVKVLLGHKEDDSEDYGGRFENVRVEFEDADDCYSMITSQVAGTSSEVYFLSILQHILFIKEDPFVRLQYYKLIEECVTQIVMHKSGVDPDFRRTQRFEIDVEPLIGNIIEKTREEGVIGGVGREKLEKALTAKQEMEAKVSNLETKVKLYEMEIAEFKAKGYTVNAGIGATISESLSRGGVPGAPPPPGGLHVGGPPPPPGMGGPPPPPPPPGMGGPPPPPPPPGMGGPPPPPPPPGMGGPPPPPPPPGMGGPPPPPPPPGMGGGPPPPPPPPGMGGPPPPPGMGGPPPPPGMGGFMPAFKDPNALPSYIKPKKKYVVDQPTKRANWNPIKPGDVSEEAFWSHVNEDSLGDDHMFATLSSKFSSKPPAKKVQDEDAASIKSSDSGTKKTSKKSRQLRVIDGKAGQSLSILLGSVKVPYREIRSRILRVDEESLTSTLIEQLIKCLPAADAMNQIAELKEEYDDLAEPEQFCVIMSGVKRLIPRLNSILFKMRYEDLVADIKPDIVAATAACEEVKQSTKFKRLLELVLLVGNYMNAGSKKERTVGFEMSFLNKLENTKSQDGKQTLLHFLASTMEERFPDSLDYWEELLHVDAAARVSDEVMMKNLSSMSKELKNLETDVKNTQNQKNVDEEDKFVEVMSGFVSMAKDQCEVLTEMHDKMQALYKGLAKFFVFDAKKYTLDEFFGDLKTFKEKFQQAVKDNRKLRETEEKIRRVREAKEKAESEKREKIARKKQLIDLSQDDDQEGVMDNLLDALSKGTAFNVREGGRKRTPRTTGAERRAQLQKSRSRANVIGPGNGEVAVVRDRELDNETPRRPDRRKRNTRPTDSMMPEEFE